MRPTVSESAGCRVDARSSQGTTAVLPVHAQQRKRAGRPSAGNPASRRPVSGHGLSPNSPESDTHPRSIRFACARCGDETALPGWLPASVRWAARLGRHDCLQRRTSGEDVGHVHSEPELSQPGADRRGRLQHRWHAASASSPGGRGRAHAGDCQGHERRDVRQQEPWHASGPRRVHGVSGQRRLVASRQARKEHRRPGVGAGDRCAYHQLGAHDDRGRPYPERHEPLRVQIVHFPRVPQEGGAATIGLLRLRSCRGRYGVRGQERHPVRRTQGSDLCLAAGFWPRAPRIDYRRRRIRTGAVRRQANPGGIPEGLPKMARGNPPRP